jgi:hypothetical protein
VWGRLGIVGLEAPECSEDVGQLGTESAVLLGERPVADPSLAQLLARNEASARLVIAATILRAW